MLQICRLIPQLKDQPSLIYNTVEQFCNLIYTSHNTLQMVKIQFLMFVQYI